MLNQPSPNFTKRSTPGTDGIPPDFINRCEDTLQQPLHDVLRQCSREGAVQQDMRDAKIVTLYKNKGDRSDCNNISLLSLIGKLYVRLQKLAERVHPESQCGFRAERSTCRQDILPPTTTGDMQRTTQAPLYSLHLPDQGLRPGPISGPKFSVFFVPQRKRLKWSLAWDEDTRKSFSTFSSLKTGRRMEGFGGFSANQHSAEHPVSPLYKLGLLVPIFFFFLVVAAGSGAATAVFLSYSNMCDVFFPL